jgi:hypothetical protein
MVALSVNLHELSPGLFTHAGKDHAHFLVVPILEYFAPVFELQRPSEHVALKQQSCHGDNHLYFP